jgi:hypothetical protein
MMTCAVNADDIRGALDGLAERYTILDEDILPIQQDVERREEYLQDRIDELEDENDKLGARVDELETSLGLEDLVATLLRSVDSDEPSLGLVLAVTDDIKKLLIEKYNISEVNL